MPILIEPERLSVSSCIRQPTLVLFLAILLAGCSSSDPKAPAPSNTATQPASPTTTSAGPCFENGCHVDLKANEAASRHQPYVDNRCLDCHSTFHTPDVQELYTQSDIDLCYRCHPFAGLGNTHPVGEGVIDPHTNQMMTCTSTCHRSHVAPYPYLLTLSPRGELCMSCHREFVR